MSRGSLALPLTLVAVLFAGAVRAAEPPNLVFVLLDATRADRFGAWGNPNRPTPVLDALAASGVAFKRHFANSHATRASMPQLMTGRYYGQSILRPFLPNAHPREVTFARPDPQAAVLPSVLKAHGYQALGVSAHPWVVAESDFGRRFDRLEFVSAPPSRGHADGADVVDRAIALWRARDPGRPAFLYVHMMDMHLPRFLPESEPRYPIPGFDWRHRFTEGGQPTFNREARRWAVNDGRAFTELDRRYFTAVYDTMLSYADQQLGRLLTVLRDADPELRRTVVVIVADHGEELADEGRTDHLDSLVDAVQHVPLIVAGGPVRAGQTVDRFTENIDVLPTILGVLGVQAPPPTRVDGRAQLTPDGLVCPACGKTAVYYAYEDYEAIRTGTYFLRRRPPGALEIACSGAEELRRLRPRPVDVDAARYQRIATGLERRLERRLGARRRDYLGRRFGPATSAFLVRPDFWSVGPEGHVSCVRVDEDTPRSALSASGWLWSGRGVTVLHRDSERPLPVSVLAPDGDYKVDAAVVPMEPMPWFFGMERWQARSFRGEEPKAFVPLGPARAAGGTLAVTIPEGVGAGNHIVGLRLSPPEGAPAGAAVPEDPQLRERLRALGYVQ